ncbi:MAG: ABC transporter substrate-binding protein [Armatimonadota bacterium]|nr:ABC transporter substrate-binding protein [Armatimonadota bacterium]MDR7422372.1 ABC transporter substrate-binding protein [Armatimonadota bacterium]MDR7457782.1 ABC transporter substrate-binding protein [Armatimonadota bacterium]
MDGGRTRPGLRAAAIVLAGALLAGIAGPAPVAAQGGGGTFTLPIIDNARMWPIVGGLPNILVNKVLYSTLVKYDPRNWQPVGDLAERWTLSDDRLTWTFALRRNVTWHDGRPFTARDVKFTIERLWLNPQVAFFQRGNIAEISRVDIVDDHTVRIVTRVPFVTLPVMLGYLTNILPEHILGTYTAEQLRNPVEFLRNPIGTGPFRFGESVLGSHVRLVAYDRYFGGRPRLDAIVFRVVADLEQQLAQLQTGQLDLMIIEPPQVPLVQRMPNVQIINAAQVNYTFVAFNNKVEPFTDRKVRQALTHAVDRKAILDKIYLGRGRLATGPINPLVQWAYTDRVHQFPYDPALAQKLLEEAGWQRGPDGIRRKGGQPLRITLDVDRGNPVREQTAVVVRQYWRDVGVDAEVRISEFNALLSRIRSRPNPLQTWTLWYITPPEADIMGYYHSTGTLNEFGYENPELDRLLEQGRATADPQARARIYQQAQRFMAWDAPVIFLVYPAEIQALSRRVQNWVPMGYRDALTHMTGVTIGR